MFEIELKNSDEMVIKAKDKTVNVNVAQSVIDAGLNVGPIEGAGEFEIGDIAIIGVRLKKGGVIYRINVEGVKIGLANNNAEVEDLDELGPIDIFGTTEAKFVSVIEPKIVIPMGNMDFSEIKAEVKIEKKLKIKNSSLPGALTLYKLD